MKDVINKQLSICFYGSSDEGLKSPLAVLHKNTVANVVSKTLDLDYESFQIITGGYGGIMDMVAKEFKKQAPLKFKTVEIIGVTCDAYDFENPDKEGYNKSNDFSSANDIVIHAESFPARLQAMIELADVFVVLPGKQGTLTELLITSESYAYSIQMFKEKNVKILVHKYWEDLLRNSFWKNLFQKSYFRKLKNIQYFDSNSFIHLLKEFQPTQKKYPFKSSKKSRKHETSDLTQQAITNPIESEFGDFYKDIERTIYGRIIDENGLKNRLKFKHGILAIDFGYYLSANSTKTDSGEYLTYSTDTYNNLLAEFFTDKNSIMFNETIEESEFEVEYLNGKLGEEETINFFTNKEIPKPEITKENSDFKTWKDYLESKKYGQTLLWRSLTNKGNSNSYKLNLSIFLLFNCYLPTRKIERIRQLTDEFLLSVSTTKIAGLFGDKEEKLQSHALQSAVAQVFARNFAHNIGSHVAIRATNRMAKERIEELYKIKKTDFKNTPEIESWLDYMGEKLDLFEVARNEFLAEYKLPAKNAMLYRDVILPFCENTLLMDNIAHSEGIHYKNTCENKLKIKVVINSVEIVANYPNLKSYDECEKAPVFYPYNFPYLVKSTKEEISIDEAFNKKELVAKENGESVTDIEICLTNEHTLYSILENFIRNSAKHNKSQITETEGLIITINVKDCDDDYYSIQLFDNVSNVSEKQLNDFTLAIQTPLIGSDGETEKKSLGIADIKINAHLLRTDSDITDRRLSEALTIIYDKERNGIFEPYDKNKASQGDYNFGYQFKLCKPKKVIWIGRAGNVNLKKKGIICIENYKNFKPEGQAKTEEPLANYQFAILELDAVKNLTNESPNYEWDDFLIKLPHRVLLNCTKDESKKIEEDTVYRWIKDLKEDRRIQLVKQKIELPTEKEGDDNKHWDFYFLKDCWENWLRKWNIKEENKGRLVIYFEDKSIAEKWKNISLDFLHFNTLSTQKNSEGQDEIFNINKYQVNVAENERVVFYDHHASGYINFKNLNTNFDFINRSAYFQYDKSSSDFVNFAFPDDNDYNKMLFLYEAFEAGLTKAFVLDERITEMLLFKDDKNIKDKISQGNGFASQDYTSGTYADLANNGNTFIASHFDEKPIIDDTTNFSFNYIHKKEKPKKEDMKKGLFEIVKPEWLKEIPIDFDCLIIHRTYLIKILDFYDTSSKKELMKDIMNVLFTQFKRVIVVSGGGYPHSLSSKINFKPYSQLKINFVKYPNKISLIKML